ncbi:unnamed protein product [Symbiodinium natans]|uniref:Uncharacterized protein n=1 Tax=Symbiodinium natans TaxID=878477 RepID=A0A812IME5_9DINO|nr:unnamed protein product [Symbiodinium natans]
MPRRQATESRPTGSARKRLAAAVLAQVQRCQGQALPVIEASQKLPPAELGAVPGATTGPSKPRRPEGVEAARERTAMDKAEMKAVEGGWRLEVPWPAGLDLESVDLQISDTEVSLTMDGGQSLFAWPQPVDSSRASASLSTRVMQAACCCLVTLCRHRPAVIWFRAAAGTWYGYVVLRALTHMQVLQGMFGTLADQWLAYALHSDDGSCASEEASSLMLLQTSRHTVESTSIRRKDFPKTMPEVIQSRGYDEAALQEMSHYMSSCASSDFNKWTLCVANKCQSKWSGNYHVVVGVPSGWGATIRDLDSVFLSWGDYDAWIWST